jgi:hypothetical protein
MTNGSWRVDETYLRVAGKWTYLYRAVDSTGDTIDFLLSRKRDADAAKHFFQTALRPPNHPRPWVINVDGNPSYPKVVEELSGLENSGVAAAVDLFAISIMWWNGSPGNQTPGESQPRLSLVSLRVEDDLGY